MSVSERRACGVLGQPRASQRYRPGRSLEEERLVARMHEWVRLHPRYGYRRITALLRREGWEVNRKRVYRLWRREGLRVPQKQRKRRRLGSSASGCMRLRAEHKDHVWTWDFIFDRTTNGRALKWFSIVDEYTRECLALEVGRRMPSREVIEVLVDLWSMRGVPKHIRSDNGPEFIARAIRGYLERAEVQALYIEPGSPWENGYAESFQSRLRDELLNAEEFTSVWEAKALAGRWQLEYNHHRPHSALGYRTPAEFSAGCAACRVGPGDYSPRPLSEPDLWATHPALWVGISRCKQQCLTRGQLGWLVQFIPRRLERHQPLVKPSVWIGRRHASRIALVPDAATAIGRLCGSTLTHVATQQMPVEMAGSFLLPNDDRPQPSPDVGVKPVEEPHALLRTNPEVGNPAL